MKLFAVYFKGFWAFVRLTYSHFVGSDQKRPGPLYPDAVDSRQDANSLFFQGFRRSGQKVIKWLSWRLTTGIAEKIGLITRVIHRKCGKLSRKILFRLAAPK